MTFLLGLMPWWGWVLIVLAGIGLAMFPAQARILAKRVPLPVWLALAFILIVFGAYRVGRQVEAGVCKEASEKAQAAAEKESAKQEKAAPEVAKEAQEAVQPVIEKRVIYVNKTNTVSCDEPFSDGVQSEIYKAEAAANRL